MSSPPFAERIQTLPPYLFAEMDRIKKELREKGVDIIDLSIGDPDLPTPKLIVDRLAEEAQNPEHHRYPAYAGSDRFRRAVALWYEDRFGVSLDSNTEILALIGSKEGIAHFPLAFINPGDLALVPDPAYPVYSTATSFAGGKSVKLPLTKSNHFRPVLSEIPADAAKKAKLLFLNYPNNPTSVVADLSFFEEAVGFARKNDLFICHDAAYTEVMFGGFEPTSFLQAKGSKEVGIEFHSMSKTFNMTGWRVGFAVGNKVAIAGLAKVKTNVDSSLFGAIQEAAITGLEHWKTLRDANNRVYERRKDMVVAGLKKIGIEHLHPRATFYIWCELPTQEPSADFCGRTLRETGVCLTPGVGFGQGGEGYFRISLTASEVRLQEALGRLERYLGH